MNADLSVEKIEIVHNKAVTQWSCQHYAREAAAPFPTENFCYFYSLKFIY